MKEEWRAGKSILSSVIAGNRRALRTIVDANCTTLIAGAVMDWFGEGRGGTILAWIAGEK